MNNAFSRFTIFLIPCFLVSCDLIQKSKNDDKEIVSLLVIGNANTGNSNNPPSNLSYNQTSFVFFRNAAISTKIPTVNGVIQSCKTNLTLPTGVNLSNSCYISGTPTANKAATSYEITGSNQFGSVSTAISIEVKDSLCGNNIVEGNEVCDDGNTAGGDGCNNTCTGV